MSNVASAEPSVGKRVGDALYLHCSAIEPYDTRRAQAVGAAVRLAGIGHQAFNVVKLRGKGLRRVSLLAYQGFDLTPFPALLDSWTVDLVARTCSHRSYRSSRNPPILHRKELLLPLDDVRRTVFADLTEALEDRGLFVDPKSIGFRNQWVTRLRKAGITIVNHRVRDASEVDLPASEPQVPIARFRTAISRSSLSAPMQALNRHGFLNGDHTVFDYGCGRGGDLAALTSAGITAFGWDPYYAADSPLQGSDIVNLGFVLNVIEDPVERSEVLRRAYELAGRLLSIAVMTAGRMHVGSLRPHRDGFLTSRGTFQKCFSQHEVRTLVEDCVDEEAIAVGPGVFFVFRDKILEQRFLERRQRRVVPPSPLQPTVRPAPRQPGARDDALIEENRELIDATWRRAVKLGRLPYLDELQADLGQEILARLGSFAKATRLACAANDERDLQASAEARTDDLTLYFALNLFGKRKRYRELPQELQRDVRAFFGSYTNADAHARKLLFSLSDPAVLRMASEQAHEAGTGCFDGMRSVQLDARLRDRLPTELRAYIGCAEQLYGDIEDADIVKIHVVSSKLTLLKYQHYDELPMPLLLERIKIDLRRQKIHFYDHSRGSQHRQVLYMKSRYMNKSLPGYRRQRTFDKKFGSLGLLNPDAPEPPAEELARLLWQRALTIHSFDIVPMRRPTGSDNPEQSRIDP